jgi:hypothetical protein
MFLLFRFQMSNLRESPHAISVERMLEADSVPAFSPSAFQALLQTSDLKASNRKTGAAMSLIAKTDEKSELSARHRTEIHLVPEGVTDATGYPHEEPVGAETKENDSLEKPGKAVSKNDGSQ